MQMMQEHESKRSLKLRTTRKSSSAKRNLAGKNPAKKCTPEKKSVAGNAAKQKKSTITKMIQIVCFATNCIQILGPRTCGLDALHATDGRTRNVQGYESDISFVCECVLCNVYCVLPTTWLFHV